MNYKNIFILLSILLFSCVEELSITDFSEDYSDYEREIRVEASILPHKDTAIIRIDQSILITDDSLFDCIDDNYNWVGSGCVCGQYGGFPLEGCPGSEVECDNVGGEWTATLIGNYICILDKLSEEECDSNQYDFSWEIIDDLGIDGLPGDPTDENENCEPDELSDENSSCLTEPSEGEGNGVPDCGEPNVDELEEITEQSDIHLTNNDCSVKITRTDDKECQFKFNEDAGSMYNAAGLIGFANGSGCEIGDQIVLTQEDLDDLSYNYGAWIPDLDNCISGFFDKSDLDLSYELYIDCNGKIITSQEPEKIPYSVVFVDKSDVNEDAIGSCAIGSESEIHDCLKTNEFELDEQQTFSICNDDDDDCDNDNRLTYISTSVWYQAIQYNDPFGDSCDDESQEEDSWYYYHGHPAVAYPPSETTNHFPPYPSTPVIYTNEEVVVSNSSFDRGCYRYEMLTFSDGYKNYYFSQLDLKDPERSNLRSGNEVVIGSFGIINSKSIDFIIE